MIKIQNFIFSSTCFSGSSGFQRNSYWVNTNQELNCWVLSASAIKQLRTPCENFHLAEIIDHLYPDYGTGK